MNTNKIINNWWSKLWCVLFLLLALILGVDSLNAQVLSYNYTIYSNGSTTLTIPANISTISAVAIGAGGSSQQAGTSYSNYSPVTNPAGSGGGALLWAYNIPVTANQSVTVNVGSANVTFSPNSSSGNSSIAVGSTILTAGAGKSGNIGTGGAGGTYSIANGGGIVYGGGYGGYGGNSAGTSFISTNGTTSWYNYGSGGGGAGGYAGNGGNGGGYNLSTYIPANNGSGGAGGGGGGASISGGCCQGTGSGGGGVGILGMGASGGAGGFFSGSDGQSNPGLGGSGGSNGGTDNSWQVNTIANMTGYGGGYGGGAASVNEIGGNGAVLIAFPSTPSKLYSINTPIAALLPSYIGGTPATSYSISPSLPAGLSFNTATGVISGTPTTVTNSTIYNVTVNYAGGSFTAHISIRVGDKVLNKFGKLSLITESNLISKTGQIDNGNNLSIKGLIEN